jgi:tetratricopeptide (TPR) repeat protein
LDDRVSRGETVTPAELSEVERLRSRSERAFRESLSGDPLEPGALFGLGWVLYKKLDYQDAIAQYSVLIANTAMKAGDREKYLEDAYLNRAVCYSLLAGPETTDAAFTKALADLEESKKIAVEYNRLPEWKVKIEKEAGSGDLRKLLSLRPRELAALLV